MSTDLAGYNLFFSHVLSLSVLKYWSFSPPLWHKKKLSEIWTLSYFLSLGYFVWMPKGIFFNLSLKTNIFTRAYISVIYSGLIFPDTHYSLSIYRFQHIELDQEIFHKLTVPFSNVYHYLLECYHAYFHVFPNNKLIHVYTCHEHTKKAHTSCVFLQCQLYSTVMQDYHNWKAGWGFQTQ